MVLALASSWLLIVAPACSLLALLGDALASLFLVSRFKVLLLEHLSSHLRRCHALHPRRPVRKAALDTRFSNRLLGRWCCRFWRRFWPPTLIHLFIFFSVRSRLTTPWALQVLTPDKSFVIDAVRVWTLPVSTASQLFLSHLLGLWCDSFVVGGLLHLPLLLRCGRSDSSSRSHILAWCRSACTPSTFLCVILLLQDV